MTRRDRGAYQPNYSRAVVDHVKRLASRGDRYEDIAAEVRRTHKLDRFTKNNVAGMISRLRKHGELDETKRCGGNASRKISPSFSRRPTPTITLPSVWKRGTV